MNTVSIIIVNFNGVSVLPACFDSLLKLKTSAVVDIIVVDNNSKDDSIGLINEYNKRFATKKILLKTIKNKQNDGFAEGNNIGYKASKGDYVLFLNSDTVVEPDFLNPLLQTLKDKKIGGVQPRMMQMEPHDYIDSIGSYFLNTGFLYHKGHNKPVQKKYLKKDMIFSMKGACMLIKREVLEQVGVFDIDYFAYFEETDLCHRIWLAGYSIYYCPESVIFHKGGSTANYLPSGFILFHSYKNRIYTFLKNFEIITLIKILPIHIILCEIISLLYSATGKINLFISLQKALLWNLQNIGKISTSRNNIQHNIRKVKDKEYLAVIEKTVRWDYYYHLFTTSLRGYRD